MRKPLITKNTSTPRPPGKALKGKAWVTKTRVTATARIPSKAGMYVSDGDRMDTTLSHVGPTADAADRPLLQGNRLITVSLPECSDGDRCAACG
jgi:hypothetical protein